MPRKLIWVDQAKLVFELGLPADQIDSNCPDLASVKFAALCIGALVTRSRHTCEAAPILDERRIVRVWFTSARASVIGFAIEASYDGGRTFENPLSRYRYLPPAGKPPRM